MGCFASGKACFSTCKTSLPDRGFDLTVSGLDGTLLRSVQAETNTPGSEVKMKRETVDFYAKVFALALKSDKT